MMSVLGGASPREHSSSHVHAPTSLIFKEYETTENFIGIDATTDDMLSYEDFVVVPCVHIKLGQANIVVRG